MASSFTDTPFVARWAAGSVAQSPIDIPRFKAPARIEDSDAASAPVAAGRPGASFYRALPLALLVSAVLWGLVVKAGLALL